MRLYLFDDARAAAWQPFTLTRPAGELLFGNCTLRERVERALGVPCAGHVAADRLRGFDEPDAPPVVTLDTLPTDAPRLFWSSRAVPDRAFGFEAQDEPVALHMAGERVGWYAPAGSPHPSASFFADPASDENAATIVVAEGTLLRNVWELMTRNRARLLADLTADDPPDRTVPGPYVVIGPADGVRGAADVRIEPGVVIDCRNGPVWFESGVQVRAYARIEGPAWFGRNTTVLGGSITAVSIGPQCRVRGEIEESVILGYTNKAHDGFLGHAYVGRWVNLGALTTNSDLKNNYSTVRVWTPNGVVDTGERKIGCLLGDHVKTAIGTLLDTGTVVGPGANIFGTDLPPKHVRPFAWGGGRLAVHEIERFLATARIVLDRRGQSLTEGVEQLYRRLWREVVEEE